MGHKNPDMDCFGATLGISRIANCTDKEAYVVLGDYDSTMEEMIEDARATGDYQFISGEKATSLFTEEDMVVVLDTHRPGLVECLDIVEVILYGIFSPQYSFMLKKTQSREVA